MLNDIRFAFRQIVKSPSFTLIAVFTLALGIGANTAIFSLINTLLLKPLPYPEPHNIVQIGFDYGDGGAQILSGGIFMDLQEHATQFESIAAIHDSSYNLTGIEEPIRLGGSEVSSAYLKTLGLKVALGRDFTNENNMPGGNKQVVVLADTLWKTQFASDPNIVDTIITLNYQPYTVIGVLPPNALIESGIDYLVPAAIQAEEWKQVRRYDYTTGVIGRLKQNATVESARAELSAMKSNLNEQYPDFMKEPTIGVVPLQEFYYGNIRNYVYTLLVAVGMVLLVACTNVANMLLAKASARQAEIAVRTALGASGWRIARQLLCESLILASLGGLVGLIIGFLSLKPLAILVDLDARESAALSIDPTVLLFTAAISIFTGLLFGAFPAFKAMSLGIIGGLRDSNRSATSAKGNKVQSFLIITEVALTVILLVSIGLLLRSFTNAFQTDPGFNQENVLTFEIARSNTKAPNREDHVRFTEQLLQRIDQIPGVDSAAMISTTPMNNSNFYGAPFWRDDQPDTANTYFTGFDSINGDFFKTIGIPLLSGRIIERTDQNENSPKVVVINEQVVKDQFEDKDPIGQIIHHDNDTWEVVGVVGSISRFSLDSGDQAMVYKPQVHWPWYSSYVVKTQLPPLQIADQVKAAILAVDPEQPVDRIRTLEQAVSDSLNGRTIMISLIGIFGVIAAILATLGIYGLMSYLVEQRTREIGIRLAIGAVPGEVVKMIFKRGLILSTIGIAIGIVLVLGLGRYLAFILYRVDHYDPLVLVTVTALTLAITTFACYRPASIASKVSPSTALQQE